MCSLTDFLSRCADLHIRVYLRSTPDKSRYRTCQIQYDDSQMSSDRIIPVLLLGVLALAALKVINLKGKKNQTFDGVIVLDGMTYEFYPNPKDCSYGGTPYVVLPNARFGEVVTTGSCRCRASGPLISRHLASPG